MEKEKKEMDTRSYSWCFTSFEEEPALQIASLPNRVCVIAKETCPTTERVHWQGYVRFARQQRFTWWKNQFPTVHVEPRRGSEVSAVNYIKDVALYNLAHPDSPPKTQGEIVCDYGSYEVDAPGMSRVVAYDRAANMIADGAPLWQVHRTIGPTNFMRYYRDIRPYWEFITHCRENNQEYM